MKRLVRVKDFFNSPPKKRRPYDRRFLAQFIAQVSAVLMADACLLVYFPVHLDVLECKLSISRILSGIIPHQNRRCFPSVSPSESNRVNTTIGGGGCAIYKYFYNNQINHLDYYISLLTKLAQLPPPLWYAAQRPRISLRTHRKRQRLSVLRQ